MSQGETASLQPDNIQHCISAGSGFCHGCVQPQMFHITLQTLSDCWSRLSLGSVFVLFMISQGQTQGKDSCSGLQLEDEGQGEDTVSSKQKKREAEVYYITLSPLMLTENLLSEGWTQLSTQASFCTTWEWWDLNHSIIFPAELVPCKSHYPAADTGQFTSHIFCCSVRPWREA